MSTSPDGIGAFVIGVDAVGVPPTLGPTKSQIFTALRAWLLSVLPFGTPVTQGIQNRVPEPSQSDFVLITPLSRTRLATNLVAWPTTSGVTALNVQTDTEISVQVDVHGPNSSDNCQIIASLWKDDTAAVFLNAQLAGLAPLDVKEPVQLPFINGEDQYEERWTITLMMQAPMILTPSAEFADTVTVTLEEVD